MKPFNSIVPEGSSSTEKDNAFPKKITDLHSNHHDDEITSHTSSTIQAPSSTSPGHNQARGKWTHNPVVLSLIACSTMHNCEEVKEIYRECVAKNDKDSMLCEAAEKYWKMCHMSNGEPSSVLDFVPYIEP